MREVKMKNYYGIAPSGHESYQGDVAYYNLLNICNGNEFVVSKIQNSFTKFKKTFLRYQFKEVSYS